MKGKLLSILRDNAEVVSGEFLSRELGISRVGVWKHIQKLIELGYDIQSTAKGYYLANAPDVLYSWEFPGHEDLIHFYPEIGSTMTEARNLARGGCLPFTVVVTDRQTQGRGRLKRTWFSESGGLYFTIITRPKLPPGDMAKPLFAASVSLAEVLIDLFYIPAGVKWPNDLLVNGKKIAGILSEMEADSDVIRYINIGIGININNDPCSEMASATSVVREIGRRVYRKQVLADFIERFEERMEKGLDQVVAAWKERSVTIGKRVRIETINEIIEGAARDIDDNGALIVELDTGALRNVIHGDCFHQASLESSTY